MNKSQKWFLVLDAFLLLLLVWGFIDTFIRHKYAVGWFIFSVSLFIIFNIVEFPWGKKNE